MQFTNPVAQIVGPDINFYDSAATKHVLIAVSGGAAFGDFDATVDITAYPPTITFDHTGASGTITVLRIRLEGYEYEEADQETLIAEDATSQTLFRTRTLQLSDVWMDENTATDLASAIINDFKDPRAIADITVSNANSTRLTEVLTREVGERVTIIEAGSNLNDTFHVERVRHEISQAGKVHKTTFTCVETIAGLVAANEAFILDDATQGKLGTGKLGY